MINTNDCNGWIALIQEIKIQLIYSNTNHQARNAMIGEVPGRGEQLVRTELQAIELILE